MEVIIENEIKKEFERIKNGLQFKLADGSIANLQSLMKQINESSEGLCANVIKNK